MKLFEERPLISVVTPLYNVATANTASLAHLIDVCATASSELILIDDGSRDGSAALLEELLRSAPEASALLFLSECNVGPGAARNLAIRAAHGSWIAYCDSDDFLAADRIEQIEEFSQMGVELCFSPYTLRENGHEWVYDLRAGMMQAGGTLSQHVERWNPSVPLGVCHTKELWERAGGFPENLVCGEDGVLWRRMINQCDARVAFGDRIAGTYIIRPDSQSRTKRPFDVGGSFDLDTNHPLGSNGQYLD